MAGPVIMLGYCDEYKHAHGWNSGHICLNFRSVSALSQSSLLEEARERLQDAKNRIRNLLAIFAEASKGAVTYYDDWAEDTEEAEELLVKIEDFLKRSKD